MLSHLGVGVAYDALDGLNIHAQRLRPPGRTLQKSTDDKEDREFPSGNFLFFFAGDVSLLRLSRQARVCEAQRSNESPSGAFKRQRGLALARWRGLAPTSDRWPSSLFQQARMTG